MANQPNGAIDYVMWAKIIADQINESTNKNVQFDGTN